MLKSHILSTYWYVDISLCDFRSPWQSTDGNPSCRILQRCINVAVFGRWFPWGRMNRVNFAWVSYHGIIILYMLIKTVPLYLFFGLKRSMSHYQRNSHAKWIFKGWFIIQPIHAQLLTVSNVEIYNLRSPPHLYILFRYIRRSLVVFSMLNTIFS